jgi:hypothetical protein
MARALARGGMEGIHVLSHESAAEILTPKRRDLITYLAENEVASVNVAYVNLRNACELLPPTALGVTHASLREVGASLFTDATCRFTAHPQRSQSPKAWIRPVPCL